mgnify:CR=1 FL=1
MPKHYKMSESDNPHSTITYMKNNKEKKLKLEKPVNTKRKVLSKRQKELMTIHSKDHSKEHLDTMKDMMKKGFCFEQAHEIASKVVGK